ncbi:MAG: PEGA domain-containing protein, partial [Acidobacteriota bacterium]
MMRALLVLVVLSAHAQAQPSPARKDAGFIGEDVPVLEIDDCPPQPQLTPEKRGELGSEHFERGTTLYTQGDYQGAVDELVAAYCTQPFYSVLKDIGQAYERELQYAKAIAYFRRYVLAVPKDAKAADQCLPDPQVDKKNVVARIQVLENLKAKIRIETVPSDAHITLTTDAGVTNRADSGREMEVKGGSYTMTIERAGYHTVTREIPVEIGKPYTFFERLDPVKGHLRIRAIPGEARLYLDRRPVGTGAFETDIEAGHYTLVAEASDRLRVTKEIDVLPDRETAIAFEMPTLPEYGRKQLLLYGTGGGAIAGGLLAGAQSNGFYDLLAVVGGGAAGLAGVYFGTPDDLALGTSSLTVTSSLIGAATGGGVSALFTDDGNTAAPVVGTGLIVGAGVGYYLGDRLHVSPGDAAVINSGAVWGTVTGALFAVSFVSGDVKGSAAIPQSDRRIAAGITLSGLAMGTAGGVLLQRYVTVSRAHAALIDASGFVGIVAGLASLQIYNRAASLSPSDERTSNFALAGLAGGLIIGGVLTRTMDEPLGL